MSTDGFRVVKHDLLGTAAGTLYVAGDSHANNIVLCCAGFPCDQTSFIPLAKHLAQAGCLVGVTCMPEYDRSGRKPLRPQGYTLDEINACFAQAVEALRKQSAAADHHAPSLTLVVHDWGVIPGFIFSNTLGCDKLMAFDVLPVDPNGKPDKAYYAVVHLYYQTMLAASFGLWRIWRPLGWLCVLVLTASVYLCDWLNPVSRRTDFRHASPFGRIGPWPWQTPDAAYGGAVPITPFLGYPYYYLIRYLLSREAPTFFERMSLDASLARQPICYVYGAEKNTHFQTRAALAKIRAAPGCEVHAVPNAGHWVYKHAPEHCFRVAERFILGGGERQRAVPSSALSTPTSVPSSLQTSPALPTSSGPPPARQDSASEQDDMPGWLLEAAAAAPSSTPRSSKELLLRSPPTLRYMYRGETLRNGRVLTLPPSALVNGPSNGQTVRDGAPGTEGPSASAGSNSSGGGGDRARGCVEEVRGAALLTALASDEANVPLQRLVPYFYSKPREGWQRLHAGSRVPLDGCMRCEVMLEQPAHPNGVAPRDTHLAQTHLAQLRRYAAAAAVEGADDAEDGGQPPLSEHAAAATCNGFFAIGVYNAKTVENVGTLWRSAYMLGASYIFTVGTRCAWEKSADTYKSWRRVPAFRFDSFGAFSASAPVGVTWVAVEMGGTPLSEFEHPERAVYLLGAEDAGVPAAVARACHHCVALEGVRAASYNVSVAGTLIMYDRLHKLGGGGGRASPSGTPPPV